MSKSKAALKKVSVNLNFPPWLSVGGEWEADENEIKAAWEMYVELVTRITVMRLRDDEGLLREALTSLHTVFATTRDILRRYGPSVAKPKGKKSDLSFGKLAVIILNDVLRPILAKWHPLLLHYENQRDKHVSPMEHEKKWEKSKELREMLHKMQDALAVYADVLASVAGVPSLLNKENKG